MATAHASRSYPPFGTQSIETAEMMDSWVDFNAVPSPDPQSRSASRLPATTSDSTLTSPASALVPLEEDFHSAKPSHDYTLFKQQTGIPAGTLGLSAASSQSFGTFDGFNSGLGLDYLDGSFDGMSSGLGGMDIDLTPHNTGLPAFFFPGDAASQTDDFVDPSAITAQEEPQTNVRFFPGMHKQKAQQAALAKAQEQARQMHRHQILQAAQQQQHQQSQQQQQQQQQQQHHKQQPSSSHMRTSSAVKRGSAGQSDARVDEIIGRVVNQIRQNSHSSGNGMQSPTGTPHVGRMRKDDDDMDDDERLLASEEGKKLSSKERRQLRNKVSARAFRSRRKEYIGQLESEVNAKASECTDLRMQNHALLEENARSRAFIEKLLRHPAFGPFLDDLSHDHSIMESLPKLPLPQPSQGITASQEFNSIPEASSQNMQVGMTMIPETPMDISMLSLGSNSNWNNIAIPGFNGFQHNPQIFAVLELPEAPPMPDFSTLSEKPTQSFTARFTGSFGDKPEYPAIEQPAHESTSVAPAPSFEQSEDFELYANSPSAVAASTTLFRNLELPTKSSRIALIVAPAAPAKSEAELMKELERMCAQVDETAERVRGLSGL